MNKRYMVRLTTGERKVLKEIATKGKAAAYKIKHAHILLNADAAGPNLKDETIAQVLHCHNNTIRNVRQRFVEEGFEVALEHKRRTTPPVERIIDGEKEARLIALSCRQPPEGYTRWTLQLLADKLVELKIVKAISYRTVGRTLKKNELKPHRHKYWVIPPEQDADFVAHMEDILDLYQRPYDAKRPMVCMDEKPVQLIKETRCPLPLKSGEVPRYDYEYERNGTAVNFIFSAPLVGWRKIKVRKQRTKKDWAEEMKEVLAIDFPEAEKVIVVCDNLNTHNIGSFYEAFEPAEARRLVKRLEIHYTPKHGSWLNIAEIEISILSRECLDRRIPDIETLSRETRSWERQRNAIKKPVDWRFKTEDARIKLKRLYP